MLGGDKQRGPGVTAELWGVPVGLDNCRKAKPESTLVCTDPGSVSGEGAI